MYTVCMHLDMPFGSDRIYNGDFKVCRRFLQQNGEDTLPLDGAPRRLCAREGQILCREPITLFGSLYHDIVLKV